MLLLRRLEKKEFDSSSQIGTQIFRDEATEKSQSESLERKSVAMSAAAAREAELEEVILTNRSECAPIPIREVRTQFSYSLFLPTSVFESFTWC